MHNPAKNRNIFLDEKAVVLVKSATYVDSGFLACTILYGFSAKLAKKNPGLTAGIAIKTLFGEVMETFIYIYIVGFIQSASKSLLTRQRTGVGNLCQVCAKADEGLCCLF